MAQYTTSDLLNSIRTRGSIPTTTNTSNVNNTTNLLVMATEELHIKLLPLIMSVREEFYVARKEYAITANQAEYAIPTRASGMVLRDVQIIDGDQVWSLPRVQSEHISTTSAGEPQAFYLEHNNVVLYPTPSATNATLRLRYYTRPSRLVATSACAQISAIDTNTSSVTVSSVPSSWATGTLIDFVRANTPHNNLAIDQSIVTIASTTITFASLPSDLSTGDWLALAEYSPIPQVPYEFQPVLAQMTVVKALEAIGDREGAKAAMQDLQVVQQAALSLITSRVTGEPKKVVVRRWR